MPDMRDAIAQYLAYTGGRMPQGGMPPQQSPPSPDYAGPQGTNAPSVPSNLQGYERLPSGQFLPGGPPPNVGPPGAVPGSGQPVVDQFMPPAGVPPNVGPPGAVPGSGQPVVDQFIEPPVNTPMQAPQQVAGMDPAAWYRMYTGGR